MSQRTVTEFTVFQTEPLARGIAAAGTSPMRLGILFFLLVSLTLTTWAVLSKPVEQAGKYVSYFENISWSLSIIFLFPILMSLSFKYYQEIPKLIASLLDKKTKNEARHDLEDFYVWLDRKFNNYWVTLIVIAVTIVLNLVYFYQILNYREFTDWMTSGTLFRSVSAPGRGLTPVGLYAAIIQVVLIYWVLNVLWRGIVLAWGLHELFNTRNFPIEIQPLHPDRCCGLRRIGDVAMLLNLTLFILGVYVSLKVIDRIVIQDSPLGADIGNPIMLGGYVILAPLLFFSPLGAAHRRMRDAREEFLKPVTQRCEQLFGELAQAALDDKGLTAVQTLSKLDAMAKRLRKEIPVWPFNFRSMQAFVGTILIPILPVLVPIAIDLALGK